MTKPLVSGSGGDASRVFNGEPHEDWNEQNAAESDLVGERHVDRLLNGKAGELQMLRAGAMARHEQTASGINCTRLHRRRGGWRI
jgi:hypothetical protein